MLFDPEQGFTSSVIKDPDRFVGRRELVKAAIAALNTAEGVIAVYGKRGVGKSSLARQVQQLAVGDYTLAQNAGLRSELPKRPRKYLTVYYSCDSMIKNVEQLLTRLCNDQDAEDGLLRLVPHDGKEIVEFDRALHAKGGTDLKVVNWGVEGVETSKYARVVKGDVVQTFRNFLSSIVQHQVRGRMKRDALLIILDEFDQIEDKTGLGSMIKSLTSAEVKFCICGVGRGLSELVTDHASIERHLENGVLPVEPMPPHEALAIVTRAEQLYKNELRFEPSVRDALATVSEGYPYMVQLLGKQCVKAANELGVNCIDDAVWARVLEDVRTGRAFPTLERQYQDAIGPAEGRQILLHLLAEGSHELTLLNEAGSQVELRSVRSDAADLGVDHIDQLLPRLLDKKYGPVLVNTGRGKYEFENPVLRVYITLRHL